MSEAVEIDDDLIERMKAGNEDALAAVFSGYRDRLKQIIRFRLDQRLAGRISDSDVLQETFIAAAKRLDSFGRNEELPAFLWLRLLVGQQLTDLYRRHLQTDMRDARREVALQQGPSPHTSMAIATQLAGSMTAVSEVFARAERIEKLETKLNELDSTDREIVALRHFEELSNLETASVLGIEPAAASKRYIRAMRRLGKLMKEFA